MPDREKVIKGLECCSQYISNICNKCPYDSVCSPVINGRSLLHMDALALLREQEPVEPIRPTSADDPWFKCGACHCVLETCQYHYCPWCGRKVKWDE